MATSQKKNAQPALVARSAGLPPRLNLMTPGSAPPSVAGIARKIAPHPNDSAVSRFVIGAPKHVAG
jgi:hypothetical protein